MFCGFIWLIAVKLSFVKQTHSLYSSRRFNERNQLIWFHESFYLKLFGNWRSISHFSVTHMNWESIFSNSIYPFCIFLGSVCTFSFAVLWLDRVVFKAAHSSEECAERRARGLRKHIFDFKINRFSAEILILLKQCWELLLFQLFDIWKFQRKITQSKTLHEIGLIDRLEMCAVVHVLSIKIWPNRKSSFVAWNGTGVLIEISNVLAACISMRLYLFSSAC